MSRSIWPYLFAIRPDGGDVEFYEATDEEMAAEIRAHLAALGLTFAELAAKAETRFDTELQRRTWFAIKDLGHLCEGGEES